MVRKLFNTHTGQRRRISDRQPTELLRAVVTTVISHDMADIVNTLPETFDTQGTSSIEELRDYLAEHQRVLVEAVLRAKTEDGRYLVYNESTATPKVIRKAAKFCLRDCADAVVILFNANRKARLAFEY